MSTILLNLLVSKVIGTSLIILILLVTQSWSLKYLNARITYQLWLMIPVYLLLPAQWLLFENTVISSNIMTFFPMDVEFFQVVKQTNQFLTTQAELLLIIWFTGATISLCWYVFRYRTLVNSFQVISNQSDLSSLRVFQTNKLRSLKLVNSKLVDVPAVFGALQSYLILPHDFNLKPANEQSLILKHEFFHLRRGDHQVNVLVAVFNSFFWFNPLVYWAAKKFEAVQEISCDFAVMQSSTAKERFEYAQALVTDSFCSKQSQLVSQWKFRSLIKERVKMLNKVKQSKWHAAVGVTFGLISIVVVNGLALAEKHSAEGAIPTTLIEPHYPRSAAIEGVEGWVKFEFDLTAAGMPVDIKVIQSQPVGVFDQVALDAIQQWRFKTTSAQVNMRYTMEFKMGDEPTFSE